MPDGTSLPRRSLTARERAVAKVGEPRGRARVLSDDERTYIFDRLFTPWQIEVFELRRMGFSRKQITNLLHVHGSRVRDIDEAIDRWLAVRGTKLATPTRAERA